MGTLRDINITWTIRTNSDISIKIISASLLNIKYQTETNYMVLVLK